jgi:rod shape-determining protein MreC
MFADLRLHATEQIRSFGQNILYPVQKILSIPGKYAEFSVEYFSTRNNLKNRVSDQAQQIENLTLLANQAESLESENSNLRKLLSLQQKSSFKSLAAEIIYNPTNPVSQKIIINRGELDGVKPGMPVAGSLGIMGQVIRVFANSSEVALLEEKDFSIPVFVERSGLRGALFGVGRSEPLELRYITNLGDLDIGDYLITSGIDGTYPPGIPVAVITKIDRSSEGSGALVSCRSFSNLNQYRHLMVLLYQPSTIAPLPTESETIKNKLKLKKGGQ